MDTPKPIQHYRTIWVSDIHLGYKYCKAEFLIDFLESNESDTLFIIGDLIDFWSLKRKFYWPSSHQKVIRLLLKKVQRGTRVIYIPGNHDDMGRDLVGKELLGIEIHRDYIYTTADDRKFLLGHGDEFDTIVCGTRLNRWLGRIGYDLLLVASQLVNRVRKQMDKPYWSLTTYVKNRIKRARSTIETFELTAIAEAKKRSLDGIICGHIHQPEMREIEGVLYCNDGDWVESCTALVETESHRLELLHWGSIKQRVKSEDHAGSLPYPITNLPLTE